MAKKIRVWDGTQWQDVAPSLPYTAIHSAQASMPLTGVDGQVWLDTDGTLAGQDFVPLSGGTMTGNLNVPSINSGPIVGRNKVLNGDFSIWQRGTSFNSVNGLYTADRWIGATNKTATISREAFTPGSAPVAGYDGTYFLRNTQTASGSYYAIQQRIEDVRTFAGQTVTLSFWAKADATVSNKSYIGQIFGSGGSSNVDNYSSSFNITTSWARYTQTVTLPSMSGKTIGSNSYLNIQPILQEDSAAHIVDIWGVQLEAGNQATPFHTATPNQQTELAACRYYYQVLGALYGYALASDAIQGLVAADSMRTNPSCVMLTSTPYGESPINVTARNGVNSTTVGSPDINKYGSVIVRVTGFNGMTAGQTGLVSAGQIALSAEL